MSTEHPQAPVQMKAQVVMSFKIYCGFLCLLYLAVDAASLFFFLGNPAELEMSALEARLVGGLLLVVGLGLFIAYLLPLLLSPRSWLWTYDLVSIGLGVTSPCFLPACMPLMIFWIKPATKNHFGKS